MKLHFETVVRLKEAIKQTRQLTLAEQMQAGECLEKIRDAALQHFGLPHADNRPKAGDSQETSRLKQHRLLEINDFAHDPTADLDPEMRDLILGLVDEASHGYGQHSRHRQAKPPQIALAEKQRAEAAKGPQNAAISAVGEQYNTLMHLVGSLVARVEALEASAADTGPSHVAYDGLKARIDEMQSAFEALATEVGSTLAPAPSDGTSAEKKG